MPNNFVVGDRVRLVNAGDRENNPQRQINNYANYLNAVGEIRNTRVDGDADLVRVRFDDGRVLDCCYWRLEEEGNAPALGQGNAIIADKPIEQAPFQVGDRVKANNSGLYFEKDEEYTILALTNAGDGAGWKVQVDGKAPNFPLEGKWFPASRFVLSTPSPWQAGDQLRVVNTDGLYGNTIEKGDVVVIRELNHPKEPTRVRLVGKEGWYRISRFERVGFVKEPVKWVPLANPVVGMKIRIAFADEKHDDLRVGVNADMNRHIGKEGTITALHNAGYVMTNADGQYYYWSPGHLEMIEPPPPVYKKGDKVVIAKKAEDGRMKWDEEMDQCLFEIGEVVGQMKGYFQVQTESGEFYYLPESLEPKEQYLMADKPLKKKQGREAVYESIAGWVKKAFAEATGVASYAVVLQSKATGKVKLISQMNDVCHARINVYGRELERYDVAALIDFPYNKSFARDGEPMKRYKVYVDYIIHRSPWSVAFKAKPVDEVIDTGVEMDIEKPAGQVAGALIALRHGTEYPEKVKSFVKLIELGIDEASAWILSFMFNYDKGKGFSYGNHTGGHQAIASAMDADVIFKFFKEGFPKLDKKPYKEDTKYRVFEAVGCDTYYNGPQYGKVKNTLLDWFINNTKFTMVGKGFDANQFVTEDDMKQLAAVVAKNIA